MKSTAKIIFTVVVLMGILAALTTFFRIVMPPDESVEKTDEETLTAAKDPLKTIGGDPEHWQFPGTEEKLGKMGWVFT